MQIAVGEKNIYNGVKWRFLATVHTHRGYIYRIAGTTV